ncbi:multidrug effflux MFS transporter [Corticimicrobacter populi]|uniref:Bcr/CflA family efflux transporter n=1 Tax=Corticimicrobacter populi TaxID=2175229 RepID=A0A2V1K457_9BURK|nr:multidrug effflux MFS transporter [Corticimicrobacter populi]PWF24143.1 Bcr/CflA family drug resistance efflux transporter [Corticimicrobacter populi]
MKTVAAGAGARSLPLGTSMILLLALLTALDAMAIDMYLPGMPAIAEDFGVPAGKAQQTLSVFLIGLAIGQGLYGPLLDRYGRRLPLLVGVLVFALGSALAALAPSIEWLMAARFLQALGAAAGLVAPRAVVADCCSTLEAARIFSLLMQVMMIAPILAPLLGSQLLVLGGWRAIFWALAGLSVLGLIWTWRALPETLAPSAQVALRPGPLFRTWMQQLGNRDFMAYVLAGGFVLSSLFAYISGAAFIFSGHFSLTPAQFSYLFAANSLSLVAGGQICNLLLRRGIREQRVLYLGLAVHTVAGLALWGVVQAGMATLGVYIGLIALAIGALGLVFGNLTALTMASAGPQAGMASALMGMVQYLMSALVGYGLSMAPSGPAALPVVIALCGALAFALCLRGRRQG